MIRKPDFAKIKKTKAQISNAVYEQLISDFVFATLVLQSLLVLNPKCHASTKPSSVVEQAFLCRSGRKPQGFHSFLSFFLSFFLSVLLSFFLTWKLIFI